MFAFVYYFHHRAEHDNSIHTHTLSPVNHSAKPVETPLPTCPALHQSSSFGKGPANQSVLLYDVICCYLFVTG